MEWPQIALTYSAAAAGTFTIFKLIAAIERRKKTAPATKPLFINGEKEEVIKQLERLVQADRDRRREHLSLKSDLERISEQQTEMVARLDRAGIA